MFLLHQIEWSTFCIVLKEFERQKIDFYKSNFGIDYLKFLDHEAMLKREALFEDYKLDRSHKFKTWTKEFKKKENDMFYKAGEVTAIAVEIEKENLFEEILEIALNEAIFDIMYINF